MQIVIDIPDEVKEVFNKASKDDIYGCFYDYNSLIGNAIKNGIVLPEKHGRLIDADVLRRKWVFDRADKEEIDEAPTILRATESEDNNADYD